MCCVRQSDWCLEIAGYARFPSLSLSLPLGYAHRRGYGMDLVNDRLVQILERVYLSTCVHVPS
jgi:hypothetical protein